MHERSRPAIAARIRSLVGECHELEESATRLGISEGALRAAIDSTAPSFSIQTLSAIVRFYGVDPSWLVTGVYDSCTHKCAISDTALERHDDLDHLISEIVTSPFRWPLSMPPRDETLDRGF